MNPEKYLIRCFDTKALPEAVIESSHHSVNLFLGDGGKAPAFREVLANEAIGIPIQSPSIEKEVCK